MDILVTGGAGYIGSSLVERLNELKEVDTIFVLDNLTRSPLSFFLGPKKLEKVKFCKGDILDSIIVDELVEKVDTIFHLAGFVLSPYNYSQNVQYEQINRWGTLNLVRSVQRANTIEKFIYLSSASVYGLTGEVKMDKTPQPTNAYGKSKFAGEKYVQLLNDSCEVQIIRSANVFGFNTGFRIDGVLNHFIFESLVNKKILIYGNGEQKRSFISLEKIIDELVEKLTQNNGKVTTSLQFNASLNEIKDWLLNEHVPNLEYTYINKDINYEEQYFHGIDAMDEHIPALNEVFTTFKNNVRIR